MTAEDLTALTERGLLSLGRPAVETLRTALVSLQASHRRMEGLRGGRLALGQRTRGGLGLVRGLHGITVTSLSELH